LPADVHVPRHPRRSGRPRRQRGARGHQARAGLLGHTYALVADAVESCADIVASLVVWGGLHIAARPADDDHPYGHGKAESLAAAVVSVMLVVAAAGIAVEAVRMIRTRTARRRGRSASSWA
jgi:cation diffusion facilitator family transporter